MSLIKRVWEWWRYRDLGYVIEMWDRHIDDVEYSNKLNHKMHEVGLTKLGHKEDGLFELFPPANSIGTAIKFANHYGIQLYVGTCHRECRAVLPRDKWQREINTGIPLETLACFTIPESHDEIQQFQGLSRRLEFAVCECLIRARMAGVI